MTSHPKRAGQPLSAAALAALSRLSPGSPWRRPTPLGGAVLVLVGGGLLYRRAVHQRRAATSGPLEAQRVMSVLRAPEDLTQAWQDPGVLAQVLAPFADVTALGHGRLHWVLRVPGDPPTWDTETVETRPGQLVRWRSVPGAALALQAELRLRPAPLGRGTETTLWFQLQAPGDQLGPAFRAAGLGQLVEGALRRFKSLMEAGEIPTLTRNPAARPA
ncbi:SRPBCC family protein [Deinococcus aquaedulcis]|uniref:SRPBCC family protein n=1 Tax=Deinococcus aquaedulcis TaxID=2840455 RepID=UPI001C838E8E|nr:SRPBCC family protein [Deinococcus aquaedulcis]